MFTDEQWKMIENGEIHTLMAREVEFFRIVRCKDCKDFNGLNCTGRFSGTKPDKDWFCGDGKRKEE